MDRATTLTHVDDERAALADQLQALRDDDWRTPSLCDGLTVREVLAHLTVSGAVSPLRWFLGVLRARFDFDRQVDDRLREQLGADPQETLARFRATIGSRTSPPLPAPALLGELVVHGTDIRNPLGLVRNHPHEVLDLLLRYYAGTDQVVVARSRVTGLRLEATDTGTTLGAGETVRGPALSLIMAMTGRAAACADLTGPGATVLAGRCA